MDHEEDAMERYMNGEESEGEFQARQMQEGRRHCGSVQLPSPEPYPFGACHYCGGQVRAGHSSEIHPARQPAIVHICEHCGAYVGCHPGTGKALGTVADKDLRSWRNLAHLAVDVYWENDQLSRSDMYRALAVHLGVNKKWCHIAMFDISLCKRVVLVRFPFMEGWMK